MSVKMIPVIENYLSIFLSNYCALLHHRRLYRNKLLLILIPCLHIYYCLSTDGGLLVTILLFSLFLHLLNCIRFSPNWEMNQSTDLLAFMKLALIFWNYIEMHVLNDVSYML